MGEGVSCWELSISCVSGRFEGGFSEMRPALSGNLNMGWGGISATDWLRRGHARTQMIPESPIKWRSGQILRARDLPARDRKPLYFDAKSTSGCGPEKNSAKFPSPKSKKNSPTSTCRSAGRRICSILKGVASKTSSDDLVVSVALVVSSVFADSTVSKLCEAADLLEAPKPRNCKSS